MPSVKRVALVAVAILTAAAAADAGRGLPTAPDADRVEVRLSRMPVRFEPRAPGACDHPEPSWVEVTEDGAPVRVVHLERRRLPAVHAVLVDSSTSMLPNLDEAKRAVEAYVDLVPEGEPVLLATFDDTLVLVSGASTDRARLERALDRIDAGGETMLWRSMRDVLDYLATFPERKVLVVITDGCDTGQRYNVRPLDVIGDAGKVENLTVFPIGLDLPRRCPGTTGIGLDPRMSIHALAMSTGGEAADVRRASELEERFLRIQDRLAHEGYVTYVPPANEAPGGHRIRVRSAAHAACGIVSAGPEMRFDPLRGPVATASGSPPASLALSPEGDRLVGSLPDTALEATRLYDPEHLDGAGSRKIRDVFEPRIEDRAIDAPLPGLAEVAKHDAAPQDGLRALLRIEASRPSSPESRTRPGFLVHGRTFLAYRDVLARALYRRPDYRAFARRAIREARLRGLRGVIEAEVPPQEASSRLERLRRMLEGEDWDPTEAELEATLAAWLGDVAAVDLAAALETDLARAALAGREPDPIERAWPALARWFPPPTEVRIVTPLVPGYDPERGVVGFYRVVLGRPEPTGPPRGLVPDAPLGLRLLRWAEGATGADAWDGVEIRGVRYDPMPRAVPRRIARVLGKLGIEAPRSASLDWRVVTLELGRRAGPAGTYPLRGYFARDRAAGTFAAAPACLVLPEDEDAAARFGPPVAPLVEEAACAVRLGRELR